MSKSRKNLTGLPVNRPPLPPQPHESTNLLRLTWKRRLLLEHFLDTALLLSLEIALYLGLHFADTRWQLGAELISWVNLITQWFCISTLMLFVLEFLVVFFISSLGEIKHASKTGGAL